ncbi:MAG: HRDC domain-containing protein [Pyrinomonadaceae bacterium]
MTDSSYVVERPDYRFITRTDEARVALESLQTETIIGLDTETYWDAALNHSRVSLVQLATPGGEVLVVDATVVDVDVLRAVVESPSVSMAAHNAGFDERILVGAGLNPVSFVDTLRLARSALRLPSYSLAGVTAHLFGIELDKSFQKSNWRRRPLTRAQLDYAAADAHVTLHVYQELRRILSEKGRFEAALRAATLTPSTGEAARTPRTRRPPLPPLRPLTAEEKQTLMRLKKWRLEKSFAERVPAYMICADRTLEHMVIERPANLEALNSIYGLGASRIARYGEEMLEALRESSV